MKVAIAGYGVEGEENFKYWTDLGADITIFDEQEETAKPLPGGSKNRLGKGVFSDMNGYDLVIRTASLNPDKIKTDGKIWSATNEFFDKCPAPIIGVTGTKGKGTTCSLIAEILRTSGKKVHLVGNIGVPALEVLPIIKSSDFVVFELSSFQLWDIKKSPETAVILMIEPDHLNIHKDMDEYVKAKSNIGRFQTAEDLMVYHPTNLLSAEAATISSAKKVKYMTPEGANIVIPAKAGIHKSDWIPNQVWDDGKGEWVVIDGNIICDISEVGLLGPHNLENISAAITASWRYTKDINAIKQAVKRFKGLPHRIELVRELDGVKYYDDSYSPNPASTRAAVGSFDQPIVLIAGGFDRQLDFSDSLAKVISDKPVKKVILMGQTANKIAGILDDIGFKEYEVLKTDVFKDAVVLAKDSAVSGDVVLLSPGCPSFDMFKNFEERGEQFKKIVGELI